MSPKTLLPSVRIGSWWRDDLSAFHVLGYGKRKSGGERVKVFVTKSFSLITGESHTPKLGMFRGAFNPLSLHPLRRREKRTLLKARKKLEKGLKKSCERLLMELWPKWKIKLMMSQREKTTQTTLF